MTDIWLDDSESAEYLGGGGGDDESAEWYDDEAGEDVDFGDAVRTVSRRRRDQDDRGAAARRRALEIQRRTRARAAVHAPSGPVTTTTAIRNTRSAVRHLDLENRVRADAFGGTAKTLGRRNTGTERAVSATAVVDTLKRELDSLDLDDELTSALQTVAEYAPLLFLRSPAKGLRNPQVVAGLTGIGLAITGAIIRRVREDDNDGGEGLAAPRAGQSSTK